MPSLESYLSYALQGTLISPEVMGSLQYAGTILKTSLFVVLGHEGCGAVKAALEFKKHRVKQLSRIHILIENIVHGLPNFDRRLSKEVLMAEAVAANVRWSMHQLQKTPEGKAALKRGARLVGAVYEIGTGRVRFLS